MTSQRKARPLLAIAAVAAIAALVAGCNSGSSGGQSGYVAPGNGGYVNTNPGSGYVNTNPNVPAAIAAENAAQQDRDSAINDESFSAGDDSGGGDGTGN